jgi:hydroxypyruvate isomerase
MPKFAANLTLLFNEVSFLDRFACARQQGFDAVEFLFPYAFEPEQITSRLSRYGLQLALFNLPPGDWNGGERGIACDPRQIDAFNDSLELALEYAEELGVRQLHCMAGLLPPNCPPQKAHATLIANLAYACERAREHGVDLLIEPLNHFDTPGYFLTTSAQAEAIIGEVGAPNLFLQYDVYHMQRMEGELGATLRRLLPLIRHIQVADNPGRHEPGSGEINFRYLFGLLDELGYAGWVGCEYQPRGDTAAGLGWRGALTAPN